MASWFIERPQSLDLAGDVARLEVWLAHGRLRVVGTDGPARIEVKKVGRKGIVLTQDGDTVSLRHGLRPSRWSRWAGPFWWFIVGQRDFYAEVIIAAPAAASSSLTVVNGSVLASGLPRGTRVDVTSGTITLMGLGGTVRAKTVSGSIRALGVAGDLGMETVSGEISLAESSAERVMARTISGSVTCDLDNPFAKDVRIDTTSGEITVRVPEDADLDVVLGATSGRIRSAFPSVRRSGGPGANTAAGRIGAGSGTLNAYAVSGSVSLLASPVNAGLTETDRGSPDHGAPDRGAPDRGAPDREAPDRGAPDRGAPDRGAPDRGAPDAREEAGR